MSNGSTVFVSTRAFPGGTIDPGGKTEVPFGGSLTLSVIPSTDYRIQRVSINGQDQSGTPAVVTLTNITEVQYVRAYFELIPQIYTVTPSAGSGGSISPSEPQSIESGQRASFLIQPDSGHQVQDVQVNGRSVGAVETYQFGKGEIDQDQTISASFESLPAEFTITPSAGDNGSVDPDAPTIVKEGAGQGFSFSATEGYEVDDVTINGKSVGAVEFYQFSDVSQDQSIAVTFKVVDESPSNEELDEDIEELDKKVEAIESERKAEESAEEAAEEEEKLLEPWAETLEKWGAYTAAVECRLKGLMTITEKLYAETLELDHKIVNTVADIKQLKLKLFDAMCAGLAGEEAAPAQMAKIKTDIEVGKDKLLSTEKQVKRVLVGAGLVAIQAVAAAGATAGLMASSDTK